VEGSIAMSQLPGYVERAMLASQTIGAILAVVLVMIALRNRPFIRDVFADPDRFWRMAAKVTLGILATTLTWITLVDNWLQLSSEPYRLSRPWDYQRVVFDPVSPDIRFVSVGLLVATAIGMAALFARHIGGYLLQAGMLIVVTVAWIPLFIFQQRLNLLVIDAAESSTSWSGVAGIMAFWIPRTGFGLLSIAATWLIVTFLIAPVVTLMLDLLRLRVSRTTHEADPFFAALGNRSDAYGDVPLKSHWRPIRRPV
jgi:hypothetical protein